MKTTTIIIIITTTTTTITTTTTTTKQKFNRYWGQSTYHKNYSNVISATFEVTQQEVPRSTTTTGCNLENG